MNDKSSGDRLKAAATGQALAKKEPQSFPQMLEAYKSQIALALPKHLNGDRMGRIALTAFRQNPRLADCDPTSVFAAVIVSAQLGLEININGQAYLVPYKQKNGTYICQFIPGWRGLVDLVNRSGRAFVHTGAVYKGDIFEYEYGTNPRIHHVPSPDRDKTDPANLLYVYAWGRVKGADYPVIEVQSNLEVRQHRDRYNKVGDKHYSYENFEAYGRKVALMQVLKYMPMSIEHLGSAIAADYSADAGHVITMKDAIDGAFLPPSVVAEQEQTTTTTGEKPVAKSEVPKAMPDQIQWLKDSPNPEVLTARYSEVSTLYDTMPIDIEATLHDRRETLKQAAAKAYSDAKS